METLNAGDDHVKLVLHRKQKLYTFLKGKVKWILIKYAMMHSLIVKIWKLYRNVKIAYDTTWETIRH